MPKSASSIETAGKNPKSGCPIERKNITPSSLPGGAAAESSIVDLTKSRDSMAVPCANTDSVNQQNEINDRESRKSTPDRSARSAVEATKNRDPVPAHGKSTADAMSQRRDNSRNRNGPRETGNPDMFVGVSRRRKITTYYVGNIDKRSTYSGFVKFLESKGVKATQIRMFYRPNSIAARINIPSVFSEKVEGESFWPNEMFCRKWVSKTEWEKEQNTRREEYEDRRRSKYYDEERTGYGRSDTYRSERTDTYDSQYKHTDNSYHDTRYYDTSSYRDQRDNGYNSCEYSSLEDRDDYNRGSRDSRTDWWEPS